MNSVYGNYRTRKFTDIFDTYEKFNSEVVSSKIELKISEDNLQTLYYLLYARYGNSNIASSDENQFKYKLYSTIFMYGPAWQRRLEIQDKLIKLQEDDIIKGSSAIYNQALNPSTSPGVEELNYINQQNTTKYKKSKLEGYAILYELIKTDVTKEFLDKFERLFLKIVEPQQPLWYINEGEENGI